MGLKLKDSDGTIQTVKTVLDGTEHIVVHQLEEETKDAIANLNEMSQAEKEILPSAVFTVNGTRTYSGVNKFGKGIRIRINVSAYSGTPKLGILIKTAQSSKLIGGSEVDPISELSSASNTIAAIGNYESIVYPLNVLSTDQYLIAVNQILAGNYYLSFEHLAAGASISYSVHISHLM